jgi:signal transduction histidine kinase
VNDLQPTDEMRRIAALRRYKVLDTGPEESFDEIVQLAARSCNTPIALITLIDEARQWFKARVGLGVSETVRESSFCAYAIQARELVVPDAWNDERFRNNPLVLHEPHIRFYAGLPLVTSDGFALGALCVIDRIPRAGLTGQEHHSLALLAREAMTQLELRRAVKELAEAKQMAEDTSAELEAFGAAVAHDLRAPIRHIDSFVTFLAAECESDSAVQNIARIRTACINMRDIIDALLRLSRASRTELNLQTVDLSALVREVAADLPIATEHRGEFIVEDDIKVRADAAMMRVALSNLLSNAWKFTRHRTAARIEFGCERRGAESRYFVRDNGSGIDPSIRLLPTRPFAKHHTGEGVGLGLTIVERIVRRHGGQLDVETAPDQGTTFRFTLRASARGGTKQV